MRARSGAIICATCISDAACLTVAERPSVRVHADVLELDADAFARRTGSTFEMLDDGGDILHARRLRFL